MEPSIRSSNLRCAQYLPLQRRTRINVMTPTSVEQLHELLTATELKLDDRELKTLDDVSE